ncbi:MAG TPA: hypothetical protein VN622_10905 [Clostridia bacterium]|nr:hypothetical protein [Clostridia bacterium]
MKVPKITYNDGAPQTLTFTYPPVQKPGAEAREALRHDTYATAGVGQHITERVDRFRSLQIDFVPAADIPAWERFIDFAILGNVFRYYPDSTSAEYTDYTLEDTGWDPKFAYRGGGGFYKFTLKLRKFVSA